MTHISDASLESIIREHINDTDGDITFRPVPTGKFNTSYFVDAGARRLVLRIAPPSDAAFLFYERHMMWQEPGLHRLILRETHVPVAPVIVFDDSHELIDYDFIIMERLPGTPLSEAPHAQFDSVLRRVGEYLAEVHELQAERYGYLGEHRPMEPQSTWPEAFSIMWNKMIDDIVATGHYDEDESSFMRELLDRHAAAFDRPVPASLLHMDIWAQNILVDRAGRVSGIVDWDRALWGDPEIEFAVLDYCGISRPPFWQGYGRERSNSPDAQIRRVFYLLYEVQKYIVIRHGRNNDPAAARRYKDQSLSLAAGHLT